MDSDDNNATGTGWIAEHSQPEGFGSTSPKPKPRGLVRKLILNTAFLVAAPIIEGTALTFKKHGSVVVESSTEYSKIDVSIVREISTIFQQGAEELFIDGYSSAFSRNLTNALHKYGVGTVRAVANEMFKRLAKPDVISEALRWLTEFDDKSTLSLRWHLLVRTLGNRSSVVRDGAILGFSALDDPRAISLLEEAGGRETVPELKRLITRVVKQLLVTKASEMNIKVVD